MLKSNPLCVGAAPHSGTGNMEVVSTGVYMWVGGWLRCRQNIGFHCSKERIMHILQALTGFKNWAFEGLDGVPGAKGLNHLGAFYLLA